MKKLILVWVAICAVVLAAQEMPVYPAETLADLLRNQKGIVENAMIKACDKSKDRYIAGFVIKFTETGDIVVKAITIKGGAI